MKPGQTEPNLEWRHVCVGVTFFSFIDVFMYAVIIYVIDIYMYSMRLY